MDHKTMRNAVVAGLTALCGCAGLVRRAGKGQSTARRAESVHPSSGSESVPCFSSQRRRATPPDLLNDCSELSSTVLKPGDIYAVGIGIGPKVCHFQDLLAPLSTGYYGTLQVHDEQEERRLETQD